MKLSPQKLEGWGYHTLKMSQSCLLPFLRYWQINGQKSPIVLTVTSKPGSEVTQGYWFWYQWKARVQIPISDQ